MSSFLFKTEYISENVHILKDNLAETNLTGKREVNVYDQNVTLTGSFVADVISPPAPGPYNQSRDIRCMPLDVNIVQCLNVSLHWNPAGCR